MRCCEQELLLSVQGCHQTGTAESLHMNFITYHVSRRTVRRLLGIGRPCVIEA
jgi:hypothetical protein